MDQYYVEREGYSPMRQAVDTYAEHMKKAEALASSLLELGVDTAEAVAKGLRTQGRWQELLLHYATAHWDVAVIRDALELVARRKADPLAAQAASILARA